MVVKKRSERYSISKKNSKDRYHSSKINFRFSPIFTSQRTFAILLILVFILGSVSIVKAKGWLIPRQPEIKVDNGVIRLHSLSLEQKIAQMIIVQGDVTSRQAWKNMQVGGIHLFARQNDHVFRNTILDFQYKQKIPFFVSVDLEGCVNPFQNYKQFPAASDIKEVGGAFTKGFREGEFLKDLGVNLNFAPVVDLNDDIWKCRAFPGDEKVISEKAQAYVLGLQNNGVIATVKHYPGKTLVVRDPHKFVVNAEINGMDIEPYRYLFDKGDVKAVMVSHIITDGEINSEGVPSVVSKKVIDEIKTEFEGLVISDEIHMLGLKSFFNNLDEMYIAVFKAGNDVILNFDANPNEVHRMIQVVRNAVFRGEIPASQIDSSVTKILKTKGFRVK